MGVRRLEVFGASLNEVVQDGRQISRLAMKGVVPHKPWSLEDESEAFVLENLQPVDLSLGYLSPGGRGIHQHRSNDADVDGEFVCKREFTSLAKKRHEKIKSKFPFIKSAGDMGYKRQGFVECYPQILKFVRPWDVTAEHADGRRRDVKSPGDDKGGRFIRVDSNEPFFEECLKGVNGFLQEDA